MKYSKILANISAFFVVLSLMVLPYNSYSYSQTECILFPPLCFVREIYDTSQSDEEIMPDDIITDKEIKVEIKFKLFEIVNNFFKKLFE